MLNDSYYICMRDKADGGYYLKADASTSSRNYYFPKKVEGQSPLIFKSSTSEKDKRNKIERKVTEVLFDGVGMIVSNKVKEILSIYSVDGLHFFPAIFIDDKDKWHENFWYLNFYKNFDCWDRNKSVLEEDEDNDVLKYYLDESDFMDVGPENRKIFRMGGATMDYIFACDEVVKDIERNDISGIKFYKVSDFEEGNQY